MARIPDLRRITVEEYPEESHEIIEKLGTVLNQFMQQTIDALNKKLNNQNLNRTIKTFIAKVDSDGTPAAQTLIKPDVNNSVAGMYIINMTNITDGLPPTGAPYVTWSIINGFIKVTNITGLEANKQYNITVEIIGS